MLDMTIYCKFKIKSTNLEIFCNLNMFHICQTQNYEMAKMFSRSPSTHKKQREQPYILIATEIKGMIQLKVEFVVIIFKIDLGLSLF